MRKTEQHSSWLGSNSILYSLGMFTLVFAQLSDLKTFATVPPRLETHSVSWIHVWNLGHQMGAIAISSHTSTRRMPIYVWIGYIQKQSNQTLVHSQTRTPLRSFRTFSFYCRVKLKAFTDQAAVPRSDELDMDTNFHFQKNNFGVK